MDKFKAVIQYDGTAYCGWQLQPDVRTVQGEIERVLSKILQSPTRIYGAGRTDTGVHATGQVAHFSIGWRHEIVSLLKAVNSLLPKDISVIELEKSPPDFHARHASISKTYVYSVFNESCRSPFHRLYATHVPHRLELDLMNQAASAILGTHDFAAFGAPTDGTLSTVRQIYSALWSIDHEKKLLTFSISGSGFLRYMVRTIVASLLRVGKREMIPDQMKQILESRNRSLAIGKAPACGLCLTRVDY